MLQSGEHISSNGILPSELIVKASEELEEDVKKDLEIPDPSEKRVVQLSGSGKLLGILKKSK